MGLSLTRLPWASQWLPTGGPRYPWEPDGWLHASPIGLPWGSHGVPMSLSAPMDLHWVSNGSPMGLPRDISHGRRVGRPWIAVGYQWIDSARMGLPWVFRRAPMGLPLPDDLWSSDPRVSHGTTMKLLCCTGLPKKMENTAVPVQYPKQV